jgi:copper chaperone NosL
MKKVLFVLVFVLAGCREDQAGIAPDPIAMTEDALGHFCQMALSEMPGPKAQIFLDGQPYPIFFAQARDGIAYLKEPEKTAAILAFYVSDMSRAASWDDPGADNWIAATDAHFVVGADIEGGMGAPELVPFGDLAGAQDFAASNGGLVMGLDDIPVEAVLGGVDFDSNEGS